MCAGLAIGYVMMGSMHAVCSLPVENAVGLAGLSLQRACDLQFLEMGVERHYQFAKDAKAIRAPVVTPVVPRQPSDVVDAEAELASAGLLDADSTTKHIQADTSEWPATGNRVQTVCTSNGSPYTNFQNRIMYATYKLAQQEPGGEVLTAFTRILHRTKPDELMQVCQTSALCFILFELLHCFMSSCSVLVVAPGLRVWIAALQPPYLLKMTRRKMTEYDREKKAQSGDVVI